MKMEAGVSSKMSEIKTKCDITSQKTRIFIYALFYYMSLSYLDLNQSVEALY
jgi:hypothetical protein